MKKIILGVCLIIFPVFAHDTARPELNHWFESLRSKKGSCCDGSEAVHLSDVDWESKDGHYRVKIEDKWWDVPDEAVIEAPNLAGPTLVWPVYYRHGMLDGSDKITIRCFMPGAEG